MLYWFLIALMIACAGGGTAAATAFSQPWLPCLICGSLIICACAWLMVRQRQILHAMLGTLAFTFAHYEILPMFTAGPEPINAPEWLVQLTSADWPVATVAVLSIVLSAVFTLLAPRPAF